MSEDKDIVVVDGSAAIMPAVGTDVLLGRYAAIKNIREEVMIEDVHYGVIPGTNKPTLLKPGAETLCTAFALYPEFEPLDEVKEWDADEPFFFFRYRCTLRSRDGRFTVGSGIGSCNSREKKYRWRTAERVCPHCKTAAIIKGKEEYGGGWLCWNKKGGCGAKFSDGDPTIEDQEVGLVPNPDIADQVNTIDKMAQKRALIAATLVAVGASEFFTQDIEDLPDFGGARETAPKPPQPTQDAPDAANGHNPPNEPQSVLNDGFEDAADTAERLSQGKPRVTVHNAPQDFPPRPWEAEVCAGFIRAKAEKSAAKLAGPASEQQVTKLIIPIDVEFKESPTQRTDRLAVLSYVVERPLTSAKELSKAEASAIIGWQTSAPPEVVAGELNRLLRAALKAQGQIEMELDTAAEEPAA
jgi:hypothetical protein